MRRLLSPAMPLLALLLAGCGGDGGMDPDHRTLTAMAPHLTRTLTPERAERLFGAPEDTAGSGLLIYKYHVDGGRTVWLGFPGYAPITYASLEDRYGNLSVLPLR